MTSKTISKRDQFFITEQTRIRTLYQEGRITPDGIARASKRISAARKKNFQLRQFAEKRRAFLARTDRHLTQYLPEGFSKTVIAIDVGFHPETEAVEEVGVTTRFPNGQMETITYVVSGHEQSRGRSPVGETVVMSLDEIIRNVQVAYDAADEALFHAGHKDIALLGLNVNKTHYCDTGYIANRWYYGDTPKLSVLAARYGLDTEHMHHSGVDSRVTMKVALKMLTDTERPYFYPPGGVS